LNFAPGCDS
jgi:hypothetical protein